MKLKLKLMIQGDGYCGEGASRDPYCVINKYSPPPDSSFR